MRKLPLLIVVLASIALTGCKWWDELWGTTPPPKPPVAVCRCAPPLRGSVAPAPAPAPAPVQTAKRQVHRAAHRRMARIPNPAPVSQPPAPSAREHEWVDGYGRHHSYDGDTVIYYTWQAEQRRAQQAQRLDPWHGYDKRWN